MGKSEQENKERRKPEHRKIERKITVIGHKNPDTDSICSAIAYADIKNRVSHSHKYVPGRAGEISSETRFVLDYFGVPDPEYISDVSTQVRDMEIRMTPGVPKEMSIGTAWDLMNDTDAVTLPVTENGKVIGLVTKGDIARTFMDMDNTHFLSDARTRFGDIAERVQARIVTGDPEKIFDHGKVLVGAAVPERMKKVVEAGDLVILVDRNENHIAALEKGAGCLILCLGASADKETVEKAASMGSVIMETDMDTYSVTREINKSVPLQAIMIRDDIDSFRLDDYTDKLRSVMASTRHRAFPVVDSKGNYIGTVSRRNLLGIKKRQLILVDHNEKSQAVDNIDEGEILEIIDHHRLGTLQTLQPIYFVNQPVGCTATILYQMYVEKGLDIPRDIAGLLAGAIISDTLMFRSPTCTLHDKMAAGALALIAEINIEDFAQAMFKAGSDLKNKSAEEIFFQDYKKFNMAGHSFGVGQISSMDGDELELIKEKIQPVLQKELDKTDISMAFFLLTNIKTSSSEILFAGDRAPDVVSNAYPNLEQKDNAVNVPGLLSRKKQLIPAFMAAMNYI